MGLKLPDLSLKLNSPPSRKLEAGSWTLIADS
jgi:hypothetical protein